MKRTGMKVLEYVVNLINDPHATVASMRAVIAGVLGTSEEEVVGLHARAITHLRRVLLDIGGLS